MSTKFYNTYKYRINDMLGNLPMKDYRKALKVIPKAMGVSSNTFTNYRNIKRDDVRDIPHQKVIMLEIMFGLKSGGLENFHTECKSIQQILNEFTI
ncbi:MAG TPA: hypothetical protein DIT07_00970 [Sphingobacteriaceae bacterium]|nr:hypothetical protein [Sphingobacteriaceae bacterium]